MKHALPILIILVLAGSVAGCGRADNGSGSNRDDGERDSGNALGACVESFNDAVADGSSPVGGSWEPVVDALDESAVLGSVAVQGDTCFASISVQNGQEGARMIFKGDADGDWKRENTSAGVGEATGISSQNVDKVADVDVDEQGLEL